MELITSLFQVETLITLLIGVAAFATVLTVASPLMQTDPLRARMKAVSLERDKLRAAQRAQLMGNNEVRLREKKQASLSQQIVDTLNLRTLFEAEASRDLLRQAGLRNEHHLVSFLAARVAVPLVLALLAFVYSSTIYADKLTPPMRLAATGGGLVVGYYLPAILLQNLVNRRQDSIKKAWSDALDLMLICVESGMSIEPAMQRVAREIGSASVPLAEELTLTVAELSYLQDRRKAYENLGKRTGLPTVKSVVTSLIQSERYGTPLGTALRVLAQENRDTRMSEAEKKAAALPPKLTVPMVLFFLPVIFIVILGPAMIGVLGLK
ncbi:type II secretion system F family protein [Aestuariivirga sp.]|uniref:type II secretion system F family protein n=1 Tax=Aestuariivirga sp. TaxID=2650926 RepID=UPI00391C4333